MNFEIELNACDNNIKKLRKEILTNLTQQNKEDLESELFHKRIILSRKNKVENKLKIKRLESSLEDSFYNKIKSIGGLALKFVSPSMNGLPDRIVFYNGRTYLVEMKLPHTKPFPAQLVAHKIFKEYGFDVWVIRTTEEINAFISHIENEI